MFSSRLLYYMSTGDIDADVELVNPPDPDPAMAFPLPSFQGPPPEMQVFPQLPCPPTRPPSLLQLLGALLEGVKSSDVSLIPYHMEQMAASMKVTGNWMQDTLAVVLLPMGPPFKVKGSSRYRLHKRHREAPSLPLKQHPALGVGGSCMSAEGLQWVQPSSLTGPTNFLMVLVPLALTAPSLIAGTLAIGMVVHLLGPLRSVSAAVESPVGESEAWVPFSSTLVCSQGGKQSPSFPPDRSSVALRSSASPGTVATSSKDLA